MAPIVLDIVKPTRAQEKYQVVNATINVFGYILRITDTHIHITWDISDPYEGMGKSSDVLLDNAEPVASVVSAE